ncbi:MAG: geranylgeranyl reductase family protein [Acidobacteria bacterium]|nr:geranylgeranyl reductase family protein [Acidobacteriota bacterium]
MAATYDALVIGAGPAGSAAAWGLARAGLRVALVDCHAFPRDKVCGDALIPDAIGALEVMGLRPAIDAESVSLRELRVYAPSGRFISLSGAFRCLTRVRLDHLLVDAAVRAGAHLIEGLTATVPLVSSGRVTGAVFTSAAEPVTIEAPFTLLAAGANATVMKAFGVGTTLKPNGVAGRRYFQVPSRLAAERRHLVIAYDRALCPGYGWIFPGPGDRFNVGVGFFSGRVRDAPSLHDLWRRFLSTFPPAAELVERSTALTGFQGAPLRTGLAGARLGRPGLLAIGESAAMTYPATGEGIGKAMESGLLAARLVGAALSSGRDGEPVHEAYESAFRSQFRPRYAAYATAQAWSSRPWLLDLLTWRASAGRFVRTELESLIAERGDPRRLFSVRGLVRAMFL